MKPFNLLCFVLLVGRTTSSTAEGDATSSLWDYGTTEEVCDLSNVVIAIKSKASYLQDQDRRNIWRSSNCAEAYAEAGIKYHFYLGMPIRQATESNSINQQAEESVGEIGYLLALEQERDIYEDVEFLPIRDDDHDSYLKTYHILQSVDRQNGEIIVLHDDEYCINPKELMAMCRDAKDMNADLYGGFNLWNEPSATYAPYFFGSAYALSRPLVKRILLNDPLMTGSYIPREDQRLGKWVDSEVSKNNDAAVLYAESPDFLIEAKARTTKSGSKSRGSKPPSGLYAQGLEPGGLSRDRRKLEPVEGKTTLPPPTSTQGHTGGTSTQGHTGGTSTQGHTGGTSTQGHTGGTSTQGHTGGTSTQGHTGGTSTQGHTGGTSTQGHTGGTSTQGHTGGTSTQGHTGGASTQGHIGGTSTQPTGGMTTLPPVSATTTRFPLLAILLDFLPSSGTSSSDTSSSDTSSSDTSSSDTSSSEASSSSDGFLFRDLGARGQARGDRRLEETNSTVTATMTRAAGRLLLRGRNIGASFGNEIAAPLTGDGQTRKVSCGRHEANSCNDCPQGYGASFCNGDCAWDNHDGKCISVYVKTHPAYEELVRMSSFQPVRDENGTYVNVILVRHMFFNETHQMVYDKYKNDILFLGIMSYETFPLQSPNPMGYKYRPDENYLSMFPGWLNMYRNPQKIFNKSFTEVKLLEMSQSDFSLPEIDYDQEIEDAKHLKRFDFIYAMSDLNTDSPQCDSWGAFAKNWSFVRDHALDIMCGELGLTGVLAVTKDEETGAKCKIPDSCKGKILQTPFISQAELFDYMRQSRFLFLPQIYDASPRVATQAMALNVPLLMNRNIVGGWKYVNNRTGEFFHNETDLKDSIKRLLGKLTSYEPREYILENYGDRNSGIKLKKFIDVNFAHRVDIEGSEELVPVFN